jgi:hypothetical protein
VSNHLNHETIRSDQIGSFLSGILDVLFGFSIVLERRGLLTRAEIAAALREMQAQIEAQEGGLDSARKVVVDLMLKAFELPIAVDMRARLQVIDGGIPGAGDPGGADDPPPPPKAA